MWLNKKLKRDLWQQKFQFFAIFLMIFIGVLAFSGIHGYMDGMQVSANQYYAKNNLADLWVHSTNVSEQDLDRLKALDHVKKVNRAFVTNGKLQGFKKVTVETNVIEENTVSKFHVVKGKGFSQEKDGIWVDSYLAKNQNIHVGDALKLNLSGQTVQTKVVGLINSPDHVYFVKDATQLFPSHTDYGFVYISGKTYKKQVLNDQMDVPYTKCYVDVDSPKHFDSVKQAIKDQVSDVVAVTGRKSNASYQGYQSEIDEGKTYAGIFSGMFLFIAVLTVLSTMNRFVKKQRVQIGTLKALGFSKRKITWHYMNFGLVISIVASGLGVIVGAVTIGQYFLDMEMSYFEIPNAKVVLLRPVYILAFAVVVMISLVTYASSRNILKETASQALRLEAPNTKKQKTTVPKAILLPNAKLSTKWNIRDIFRNKARTLASLAGVVGCTVLMVCAFGLFDSMNAYMDWEYEILNDYQNKVLLDTNYTDAQYDHLTSLYGNASSETFAIECKVDSKIKVRTLTINDSKGKLKVTDHNKKVFSLKTKGMYLTEKLAREYDVHIGDTFVWRPLGSSDWKKSKVVGLNRDPQAQQCTMTKSAYEKAGFTYRADTLYTNKKVKKIDGVMKVANIRDMRKEAEKMVATMKSMMVLLIVFAVILGSVILYNLGILSFTEKQYQFATLKVLGFKNKQIKEIFMKQNTWIMLVAILFGLPLGYYLTDYIYREAISDTYDFNASIRLISYVIATVGTFGVSFFINQILARKIKTIDMVTSLKGNE